MPTEYKLGILCGVAAEAEIAAGIPNAAVEVSAASRAKASALAERLARSGVETLISFGLAGGLDPDLPCGTIVFGEAVLGSGGVYACDPSLVSALKKRLPNAVCGKVWDTRGIVAKAAEKRALRAACGCLIADMESGAVAEAAVAHGIRFAVARAVLDDAATDLPPAALLPLQDDGGTDRFALLKSLSSRPRQIPSLIRLGLGYSNALKSLNETAKALASGF